MQLFSRATHTAYCSAVGRVRAFIFDNSEHLCFAHQLPLGTYLIAQPRDSMFKAMIGGISKIREVSNFDIGQITDSCRNIANTCRIITPLPNYAGVSRLFLHSRPTRVPFVRLPVMFACSQICSQLFFVPHKVLNPPGSSSDRYIFYHSHCAHSDRLHSWRIRFGNLPFGDFSPKAVRHFIVCSTQARIDRDFMPGKMACKKCTQLSQGGQGWP